MNQTEVVSITLNEPVDRSYEIIIGPGAFANLSEVFDRLLSTAHAVIITDDVVNTLYHSQLVAELGRIVKRIDTISVSPGEAAKSVLRSAEIWDQLLAFGADRKTTIIALGGGVIGDLAGFAAATFGRGLNLIQIPTTLLAQVDSSVGGKVGINLTQAKNIIGAFWQPRAVLIDPLVLKTLDQRNYRAGMAEVIKYGVIMDRDLFEYLEHHVEAIKQRDPAVLSRLIAWCCRCKARVVEQDERELTGLRAILNYGHTLGHAIESVFGYGTYLHGEAISIGMHYAARLACELGLFRFENWQRQADLLTAFDLPIELPAQNHPALLRSMRQDKKASAGVLNLVLPEQIGQVILTPAPSEELMLSIMQQITSRR